jgi:ribosome-binding protein aMBF1 (putative translation factor)
MSRFPLDIDYILCAHRAEAANIGDVDDPITDPRKPLGQTIRARREALGLTQEQLAEKAGLHWTFISGVERGIRNISILKLHRIATSLGVRLRDLVDKC